MTPREDNVFSVAEAREITRGLFVPNPIIYWADLLISLSIAYGFATIYIFAPSFSAHQIGALFVSGFALHRVANFIHEVAHLNSKRSLRSFQTGWNILAGIPMLMPSFFFDAHMAHHNTNHYGTRTDCEYVALGRGPIFPSMPYHNLGVAHRRLMAELPLDSPYHHVVYPNVWSVLRILIANSHRAAGQPQRRGALGTPVSETT